MKNITAQDLQDYINEDKELCYIDVRTPAEFATDLFINLN